MSAFANLGEVVADEDFPELDLALRRGRHVDRDDTAWYALLTDAQDHLEALYRRYGCELVHKADGFFYLLPTGEKLSRRQLGAGDMLVGQALALLYLDPATIERGGRVSTEDVIARLVLVLGSDALVRAFNPKRRRYDERVAQKTARGRVGEAIRHLAALGFLDAADDEQLRLRPALLRFAEPVRGLSAPGEALAKLVASGEVTLADDAEGEEASGEVEIEADDDAETETETEAETETETESETESESGNAARADLGIEPRSDVRNRQPVASRAVSAAVARTDAMPRASESREGSAEAAALLGGEAPPRHRVEAAPIVEERPLVEERAIVEEGAAEAAALLGTSRVVVDDDDPPYVFDEDDDDELDR